jgi:hypothetical protein
MSATSDTEHAEDVRWQVLRHKIEALRPLLRTQGSLVCKQQCGQVRWCLRYYDTVEEVRTQRTLYVGNDAHSERVRALLADIRAPGAYLRETLRLADLMDLVARAVRRRDDRSGA